MPEKVERTYYPALYVDGLARILWIGRISKIRERRGAARIKVYWIEIESDAQSPDFNRCNPIIDAQVQEVDLPIGYLTHLHVNAILQKGLIVSPWSGGKLHFEHETIKPESVDFSRKNLTLFNRRDLLHTGEPIIPIQTNRLQDRDEANTKCIGVRDGDDPYAIIFPCTEILRFFYCTSTTMAHVLFDGRINTPEIDIYDSSEGKAHIPIDDHVFITLRRGMLDGDARIIASMFADNNLRKSMQDIAAGVMNAEGEYRDVIAFPPVDGECKLSFFYILKTFQGKTRKLVTRIIKSYHKPKFSYLQFDREDQFEKPNFEGEEEIPDRRDCSEEEREPQKFETGTFGDPRFATDFRRQELGSRFPELEAVNVQKIPSEKSDARKRKRVFKNMKGKLRDLTPSAGKGKNDQFRKVNIQPPSNITGSTESDSVATVIGAKTYIKTIQLLDRARSTNEVDIAIMEDVLPHFKIVNGTYFNVYPINLNQNYKRALFHIIDKENQRARMALIVKIKKDNEIRYLVDFQQQHDNEVSYQVFWFDSSITEKEVLIKLRAAMISFASTKTAGECYVNVVGIKWGSFNHLKAEVSDDWIIEKTFNPRRRN